MPEIGHENAPNPLTDIYGYLIIRVTDIWRYLKYEKSVKEKAMKNATIILKNGERISRYISHVKWSEKRGVWRGFAWINGIRRMVVSNSALGPFRPYI